MEIVFPTYFKNLCFMIEIEIILLLWKHNYRVIILFFNLNNDEIEASIDKIE